MFIYQKEKTEMAKQGHSNRDVYSSYHSNPKNWPLTFILFQQILYQWTLTQNCEGAASVVVPRTTGAGTAFING
jgi:hypothetical protein